MGGAVSTGRNNDDLINNLLEADYIRTPMVERVFRSVDRGEYFLPEARFNAYKDVAWKSGNLHISAPCIYSEVMEGLCLRPGLSFLNLGSGTGYLSTMVGLILGNAGINHGIEIHDDVVQYAKHKVEIFKKLSGAMDEFDFCEPKFMQGNCLCLRNDTRQYDRIYCGAGCPEKYEDYIKNLLKEDGILVMPLNDQLLQMKRNGRNIEVHTLLPVSFATLIQPPEGKQDLIQIISLEPHTLQELCRIKIRNILRRNIEEAFPNLRVRTPPQSSKKGGHTGLRSNDQSHVHTMAVNGLLNYVFGDDVDVTQSDGAPDDRNDDGDEKTNDEAMSEENNEPNEENAMGGLETPPNGQDQLENGSIDVALDELKHKFFLRWIKDTSQASASTVNSDKETPDLSKNCRERFDSGIGERENMEMQFNSSDSSTEDEGEEDEEEEEKNEDVEDVKSSGKENNRRKGHPQKMKFRRITLSNDSDSNPDSYQDSDQETERKVWKEEFRVVSSPYTAHLKQKIEQLPLPSILKNYINFYREF